MAKKPDPPGTTYLVRHPFGLVEEVGDLRLPEIGDVEILERRPPGDPDPGLIPAGPAEIPED